MPNTRDHLIDFSPPIEDPAPQFPPDEDERLFCDECGGVVDPDTEPYRDDMHERCADAREFAASRHERECARADAIFDQRRDDALTDPERG